MPEPLTTAAVTAAVTAGGIGVLKKSIEKAFNQFSTRATGDAATKLAKWRAKKAVQVAVDRLFHLRMVKTIWQIDKAVDITEFYYPSKLRLLPGKPAVVNRISDIPHAGNVIIQGTVGQGKSIFLRHLATFEALDGIRLPLFIELRRILVNDTLESHIMNELSTLGVPASREVFSHLASSGQVALLLDAFDEVREERRERLIAELEILARKHPELPIIITSRPNSGIERSTLWVVVQLVPLEADEYEDVVKRLCHDEKVSAPIVAGLRTETGSRITPMLTTPLMVALLVLRYRADQSIPETRADFFADLFMLLLQRHDKTKAGYVRQRKSKLGDKFLERVFVAICYLTKKRGESAFSNSTMFDITREALRIAGASIDSDADAVLDDVKFISCLLLEEGGEWRFLHKFVQEYHAASFIASFEDVAAQRFYDAMCANLERFSSWREELGFLQSIDTYRAFRMYLIPMLERLFGTSTDEYDAPRLSKEALTWLGVAAISKRPDSPIHFIMDGDDRFGNWFVYRLLDLGFDLGNLWTAVARAIGPEGIGRIRAGGGEVLTFVDLGCHSNESVEKEVRRMVAALWEDLRKAREYAASVESRRNLVSF